MVTMRYDGEGRRVELVTRPNGGAATTTAFRYQGSAIAQELTGTGTPTLVRTYVTDEAGTIVKVCDPDCTGTNPAYLVTHNGHGDALALWRITGDGSLTLANSYTYSTWGAPTTATHNAYPDLGYRYLYVGAQGVAWDNALGLGLLHMGARHYSPSLGRFLQPDPSALEANLYGYGANSPITRVDPSGEFAGAAVAIAACMANPVCVAAIFVGLAYISGQVVVFRSPKPILDICLFNCGPGPARSVTPASISSLTGRDTWWRDTRYDDNKWRRELDRRRRWVDPRLGIRYYIDRDYAAPGGPPIGPPRSWCRRTSRNTLRCVLFGGAGAAVVIYYTVNQSEIDRRADGKR